MKYYIYRITCTENNKVYIGQTKNKRKRIDEHKYDLRHNIHHSIYMQRAFNKYGEKSFKFEIIEECSEFDVDEKECYWIKKYNSTNKNYGYNSESGGNKNKILSKETKSKLSIKGKNRYITHYKYINSKEAIKKRSISNTGKKRSDEFRKRMSEIASNRIGEKNSFYGKTHTEETKKKISLANKGGTGGGKPKKKIKVINIQTGESKIFNSKMEASKNGFPSRNSLNKVINGEYSQYNGYKIQEI